MHRHDIVSLMNKLSKCVGICQHMQAMAAVPPGRGGVGPARKGQGNVASAHNFYFFYAITAPSQPLPSTHHAVRI